jgi:hypothetical protein
MMTLRDGADESSNPENTKTAAPTAKRFSSINRFSGRASGVPLDLATELHLQVVSIHCRRMVLSD